MYYIMDVMDMTSGPIYCTCCIYNETQNIEYILITNNSSQDKNISIECPICLEDKHTDEIITTNCGHDYCLQCIKKYFDTKKIPYVCAYCRTRIDKILVKCKYLYMKLKIQQYLHDSNLFDSNIIIRIQFACVLSVFIMIISLGVLRVS